MITDPIEAYNQGVQHGYEQARADLMAEIAKTTPVFMGVSSAICLFCHAKVMPPYDRQSVFPHGPDCLWRRAASHMEDAKALVLVT